GVDLMDSRHRRRGGTGRNAHLAAPWTVDARFDNRGVFAGGPWFQGGRHRWMAGARVGRAVAEDLRAPRAGGHARVAMPDQPAGAEDLRATVSGGHGGMAMPNPTAGRSRDETRAAAFVRFEQDVDRRFGWYAGLGRTERMPDYWELFSADMGPVGALNAFDGL